jgi:hypothetical protein
MNNTNYLKAFLPEQRLSTDTFEITFTTVEVGELVLTSGKLVACDPLTLADSAPFTINLEAGSYPVLLSIAHIKKNDNQQESHAVAYAMIRLSDETQEPLTWQMATHLGETPSSLREEEFFGYSVDSGSGSFMDSDVASMIDDSIYAEDEEEILIYQLQNLLEDHQMYTCSWANMCVDRRLGANVIAFSSGWGDGVYPTYIGIDRERKIISVVTDFHVCPKSFLTT